MTAMLDQLKKLNKGDQVSLLLAGILVEEHLKNWSMIASC